MSTTPSLTNQHQPNGSWTIRLDDLYIDEEKLPHRLDRIFPKRVDLSWELDQWVIQNAPRAFSVVSGPIHRLWR
jgi:hypothetical protein